MAAQPMIDRMYLAAGGGSCGVTQAANVAAMHHDLKALVLLSGTVAANALKYLSATTTVAVFGASAVKDASGGNAVTVARASKNPHSTAAQLDGTSHAAQMLIINPGLQSQIVRWLSSVLNN